MGCRRRGGLVAPVARCSTPPFSSAPVCTSPGILVKEVDLEFAPLMVQNLNLILLTAPELEKLRRSLMAMATPESFSLFVELYKSWCHSPVATLALRLLAQVYDHACQLLDKFAELEVTVELLVEVRVRGALARRTLAACC